MVQNKGRNMKKSPSQVDTSPKSTPSDLRSTLETSSRELFGESGTAQPSRGGKRKLAEGSDSERHSKAPKGIVIRERHAAPTFSSRRFSHPRIAKEKNFAKGKKKSEFVDLGSSEEDSSSQQEPQALRDESPKYQTTGSGSDHDLERKVMSSPSQTSSGSLEETDDVFFDQLLVAESEEAVRTEIAAEREHAEEDDVRGSEEQVSEQEEKSDEEEIDSDGEEAIHTPSKAKRMMIDNKPILHPRIININDEGMAALVPELLEMLEFQGWSEFVSMHRSYYALLVKELFRNMISKKQCLVSNVRGVHIELTIANVSQLLKIPNEGVIPQNFDVNAHEAFSVLAGLPHDVLDVNQTNVSNLNANRFPPAHRLLHHWCTTILTPQGGGRQRVTTLQRNLMFCLIKKVKINLATIFYQLIQEATIPKLRRSLPYATHLSSVLQLLRVSVAGSKVQNLTRFHIYDLDHIVKFMKLDWGQQEVDDVDVAQNQEDVVEEVHQDQTNVAQEEVDTSGLEGAVKTSTVSTLCSDKVDTKQGQSLLRREIKLELTLCNEKVDT
ncbi:hypothetical protein Taro_041121, partial [Colocasia esculenta]|nr:hypothetical protein [Colocasia esculenta]